jgi:hypothetical protein
MTKLTKRSLAAAALLLGSLRTAHGFLGIADTSFVTVIANPAEASNWAADLEKLNSQLEAARSTLQTVGDLRTYAGDPKAALVALRDLNQITAQLGALSSGAQTDADLLRAWQALGASQRLLAAATLLEGAGAGATMTVFGKAQARDPSLYDGLSRGADASARMRAQVAQEQATRSTIAGELALAWSQFRSATTESSKQAILTEISQLQSQNQVMDSRRRALLDDLELSDRQDRTTAGTLSKAADEQLLAESSLLNASASGRAKDAEAQRMATLRKQAVPAGAADYSGLRMWTTADAGGTSN